MKKILIVGLIGTIVTGNANAETKQLVCIDPDNIAEGLRFDKLADEYASPNSVIYSLESSKRFSTLPLKSWTRTRRNSHAVSAQSAGRTKYSRILSDAASTRRPNFVR
jgi:hypothetical protein